MHLFTSADLSGRGLEGGFIFVDQIFGIILIEIIDVLFPTFVVLIELTAVTFASGVQNRLQNSLARIGSTTFCLGLGAIIIAHTENRLESMHALSSIIEIFSIA